MKNHWLEKRRTREQRNKVLKEIAEKGLSYFGVALKNRKFKGKFQQAKVRNGGRIYSRHAYEAIVKEFEDSLWFAPHGLNRGTIPKIEDLDESN